MTLTQREEKFVERIVAGDDLEAAATKAGFDEPTKAVVALLKRPAIAAVLVHSLQDRLASWEVIAGTSRRWLSVILKETHDDDCPALAPSALCSECLSAAPLCGCGYDRVSMSDRLKAIAEVNKVLSRSDPETLAGRAEREDKVESREAVARRLLGGVAVIVVPEGDGTGH